MGGEGCGGEGEGEGTADRRLARVGRASCGAPVIQAENSAPEVTSPMVGRR